MFLKKSRQRFQFFGVETRLHVVLLPLLIFLSACASSRKQAVDFQSVEFSSKPKNIILLIGDGMALAQVSAHIYWKGVDKTVFEQFSYVGFHKSHSCDDLVTDSAAGATAFSCGQKTTNGAIGVLEASTAAYPGYLKRVQLHGSAGSAIMEEEDLIAWDFAQPTAGDLVIREKMAARQTGTGGGASDPTAIGHHGHAHQFADVVEAIEKKRKPAVDGYEGRRSVEIILGIYLASETGGTVTLPLASDPVLKARLKKVEK